MELEMLVWRNGSRSTLKMYRRKAWGFESLYQHQFEMKLQNIGWDRWLMGSMGIAWILLLFCTGHADAAVMLIIVAILSIFAFKGL